MNDIFETVTSLVAIVFVTTFFLGIWTAGALWTERTVEYWFHIDLPLWVSFIITLVLNGMVIAINLVSEIIRLFM